MSVSAVRRELTHDLELHGLTPNAVDDVTLVASELLGNAIRYGGMDAEDEFDIDWTVGSEAVVLSVEDHSHTMPTPRRATADDPGGRGLAIVETIATAWGAEQTRRGKRVWAKIRITPMRTAF